MPNYHVAKKRVEELEQLLTIKGNKALIKYITPQPLRGEKFQTYFAMELFFKQLLKIHDADNSIDFDYSKAFFNGTTPDYTPLYEPLGELIILATTYLERLGCNAELRQLLFEKLNRRNNE